MVGSSDGIREVNAGVHTGTAARSAPRTAYRRPRGSAGTAWNADLWSAPLRAAQRNGAMLSSAIQFVPDKRHPLCHPGRAGEGGRPVAVRMRSRRDADSPDGAPARERRCSHRHRPAQRGEAAYFPVPSRRISRHLPTGQSGTPGRDRRSPTGIARERETSLANPGEDSNAGFIAPSSDPPTELSPPASRYRFASPVTPEPPAGPQPPPAPAGRGPPAFRWRVARRPPAACCSQGSSAR